MTNLSARYSDWTLDSDDETWVRTDEHGNARQLCECIYEVPGHMEGEDECPYGPHATTPHPDGVTRG